jgi:hypothetical protein
MRFVPTFRVSCVFICVCVLIICVCCGWTTDSLFGGLCVLLLLIHVAHYGWFLQG